MTGTRSPVAGGGQPLVGGGQPLVGGGQPLVGGGQQVGPYQRLWAADPGSWRAAGSAWRAVLEVVDRRRAELRAAGARLLAGWSGPAGRAAGARLAGPTAVLALGRPAFIEIDQVLAEFAAALTRARALLAAAVEAADAAGVLVDRHGRVSRAPTAGPVARDAGPDAGHAVRAVAARIAAALTLAETADRTAAGRLTVLAAAARAGWTEHAGRAGRPGGDADPAGGPAAPGGAGSLRPPGGAEPADVRRWWDGLTAAQRRWLVAHEPTLVGRTDGVPADARDQANRLLLAERGPGALAERGAALADRLGSDSGQRAYLLALDQAGDGRAVLAIGNPDRADHVVSYVPGMQADLPGIGAELIRVDRLAEQCAVEAPGRASAAVLWLDYDAPDFVDEAASDSRARDAGPALHRFQEGLRASNDGPPAGQTVVGYSYGALVVGTAARDHGLAADQVVLLGAPGVGVDRADGLGLPAGQVWAGTARDDPIQYAALAPGELLERLAVGVFAPLAGPLAFGQPAEDLWFGRNPADAAFGAGRIPTGPGGHAGYWTPGGPALAGVAEVATRP
ncbi:alpha/beta hydrolase [Solwaraspora sp. WMMD1047]|uniref:alpha/beta hydrolase n=1 Tax=Solwaraspora sp. WMMD1047 TaxID=3016102 RepID=UPI0024162594|nr:alpha/beta hydrolase [Solwaraspora sp. WMMD1047]MDG4828492.1 alpha/beta hydrolase [Solwaraspora sp. WMMD1047]